MGIDGSEEGLLTGVAECAGLEGKKIYADEESNHSRLAGKNVKIARPSLTNYIYTREEFEHYTNELWQMMSKEKFNVQIHEIYPLQDVARAHTVSMPDFRQLSAHFHLLTLWVRISKAVKRRANCYSRPRDALFRVHRQTVPSLRSLNIDVARLIVILR